jgi:hypothetical protein
MTRKESQEFVICVLVGTALCWVLSVLFLRSLDEEARLEADRQARIIERMPPDVRDMLSDK